MFPRRKLIGLELIGLFMMLLCAGSTWGTEAVGHIPYQPINHKQEKEANYRRNATQSELPVSSPSIAIDEIEVFEKPQEKTYANFSFTFWELSIAPVDWKALPIIPDLSDTAHEILLTGLANGNNPHAFSTIGDCQSFPAVFMGIFDTPDAYELPSDDGHLYETIAHFTGSFARESVSVSNGFSAANVLSPLWGDPDFCLPNESPLECEFRIHNPIVVFINLGTNWETSGELTHEEYLRQVIDFVVARGVLPILSTKGDNIEGNHSINEGIASVAGEYDIPLWNFWWSIQYLPQQGIDEDRGGNYLTVAAWNKRSYSGLRMLYQVYDALMELQSEAQ